MKSEIRGDIATDTTEIQKDPERRLCTIITQIPLKKGINPREDKIYQEYV